MTVTVSRNAVTKDQLWAALRQVATVIGGWAIGKGYMDAGTASALGTILLIGVPIAIGQIKTRKSATDLTKVAKSPNVPDAVAQIKE